MSGLKPWTPEEDRDVLMYRERGMKLVYIQSRLKGRTVGAISGRLDRLKRIAAGEDLSTREQFRLKELTAKQLDARRVDRDPCGYCGTRKDLGCECADPWAVMHPLNLQCDKEEGYCG